MVTSTAGIGLQLGSKICEKIRCVCKKHVSKDWWHGLSCLKNAGRISGHSNLTRDVEI